MSDAGRILRTCGVLAVFVVAVASLSWLWFESTSSTASFGDAEVFDGNRLGAGTVDIATGGGTANFSVQDMVAGDVAAGRLELINQGSLPLRYEITPAGSQNALGRELTIVAWNTPTDCGDQPPTAGRVWDPTAEPVASEPALDGDHPASGALRAGERQLVCMAATLPLSAPNTLQGQRYDLELHVVAEHDLEAS